MLRFQRDANRRSSGRGPRDQLAGTFCTRRRVIGWHARLHSRISPTNVLPQKIEREGRQNDVLHQEGPLPVIAGKPPAATSQPSGMNGMIVTVAIKVPVEPRAPRTPIRLSQKPASNSEPKVHSETPRKWLAPAWPKTGYSHQINGPLLMNGTSLFELVGKPLLVAEEEEHDHHRGADDMVVEIVRKQAGPVQCARQADFEWCESMVMVVILSYSRSGGAGSPHGDCGEVDLGVVDAVEDVGEDGGRERQLISTSCASL